MNPLELGRIAHPTDLSAEGDSAFAHALRLSVGAHCPLDLIHVDPSPHAVQSERFPSAERLLTEWGVDTEALDLEVTQIAALGRNPVQPILDSLDEFNADLLVVATHQRQGLERWLRRDVAKRVARHRALPTLFVPVGEPGFVSASTGRVNLERVLVPVDWTPSGQPAVDGALTMADTLDVAELEMVIFHVGESVSDFPSMEWPQRDGLRLTRSQHAGDVVDAIIARAEELDADLVVMATAGRQGLADALRGSTTEQVLQRLRCPLLVVPNLVPGGVPQVD
ncbi:MAG: universal stress protein [Acidobacteriota bacterium]